MMPEVEGAVFVPMSRSRLWTEQRAYFEAQGPDAWATGAVPHQVTCSPAMGRALAEVIVGFAADRARASGAGAPRTLHVIELGAGSGRLGFQVVRALRAATELAALGWRVVYVLTDLAEATVAWWQRHPWLAPLVAAGLLDFARFDVAADDEIALRVSGRRLAPDAPADELVAIANYVFDSLPVDVFERTDGGLREWEVADAPRAYTPGAPLAWGDVAWRAVPVARRRYAAAVHQRVLDGYRDARGTFTMPAGALAALDRVRALARGPLLVLSADKGGTALEDAVGAERPDVVHHGSVSIDVNYHAIGAWAVAHGGTWMHADHHGGSLELCAFVLGAGGAAAVPQTLSAFARATWRGPDDLHALKRVLVEHAGAMTLAELLAYLRLSGHDPRVFVQCARAIRAAAVGAPPPIRADLARALARVWDAYLPIGERTDVAYELARVYAAIGHDAAALSLLDASRALHGDRMIARALAARCRRRLGVDDPLALVAAGAS